MKQHSSADLHVHSKYSDRPSEWILRRIGSPESFVDPLEVYRVAKDRGLDFVTISDHNCISGALEIAHLPDTFISCEVTTYFPEDDCKIHCLVTGITETQFAAIQDIRRDIYDFRRYLAEQDIVYSVAHPLFRVNDRLTPAHVEKLILLFDRFEAINGTRDPRACEMARALLDQLTPRTIERMADRHGIPPVGPTPWIKRFTGGSDDHSGRYVGAAFTRTPHAANVDEFLDHLRAGRHEEGGSHGNSVLIAHCFYQIASSYYRHKLLGAGHGSTLVAELFRRLLNEPAPKRRLRWVTALGRLPNLVFPGRKMRKLTEIERSLVGEFSELFETSESRGGAGRPADRRAFELACDMSQQLAFSFLGKFAKKLRRGQLIDSLQTFASLGPVALAIAPYLAAFKTQHKDERFLQQVAQHFPALLDRRWRSDRRAWVTDTIDEINGVSRTIRTLSAIAKQSGRPLTVVSCAERPPRVDFDLVNFQPLGMFELPEYEDQRLAFPPFLEILEYLERERFAELWISTPGPMGLVARTAAGLLGMRTIGIYHTDFPEYVRQLTGDATLEALTWRFMSWFYDPMDVILVPSNATRDRLVRHGFPPEKLSVLGRGVDTTLFSPGRRRNGYWERYGLNGAFKFLYVGRVSKEKNIDCLLGAFEDVVHRGLDAELVVVGDGPILDELRESRPPRVLFTGPLTGERLAEAYASADAFVFPSLSDTFGNAVLEAHASGLPAVVFDQGGPPEVVSRFDSGVIVPSRGPRADREALRDAMVDWIRDPNALQPLRDRARTAAEDVSWQRVCDALFDLKDLPNISPALEVSCDSAN
ncbi:MAG: glycosyltransferase [Planctomycetes bacterium]|nr:glycosyltransferase [Planctomycetota bacterium]